VPLARACTSLLDLLWQKRQVITLFTLLWLNIFMHLSFNEVGALRCRCQRKTEALGAGKLHRYVLREVSYTFTIVHVRLSFSRNSSFYHPVMFNFIKPHVAVLSYPVFLIF
jgi:hypothetical protein